MPEYSSSVISPHTHPGRSARARWFAAAWVLVAGALAWVPLGARAGSPEELSSRPDECRAAFAPSVEEIARRIEADPESRVCLENVPSHYRDDPDFLLLAWDPDRDLISPQTIREAMAGVESVRLGWFEGPIRRGPMGSRADYFDAAGRPLDIKTPRSPNPETAAWRFDAAVVARSVAKKLAGVANEHPENPEARSREPIAVVLDTTYLTDDDRDALLDILEEMLSLEELARVHELTLVEPIVTRRSFRRLPDSEAPGTLVPAAVAP